MRRPLLTVLVLAAALAVAPSASARFWLSAPGSWMQVTPKPEPHLIVSVRPGTSLALRSRPFGPVVRRVGSSTEFGSPRALAVLRTQRGRWLAVTQPELGNRLGWVDAQRAYAIRARPYASTSISRAGRWSSFGAGASCAGCWSGSAAPVPRRRQDSTR